jgi:hypothetical protein
MGQPRRNEKRSYRYPLHRVVAVLDDAPNLGLALADLGAAGIDVSKVNVLSGPPGVILLDPTGVRHGLRGRFLRWRQRYGYETDALQAHTAALLNGQHVVYVRSTVTGSVSGSSTSCAAEEATTCSTFADGRSSRPGDRAPPRRGAQ